MLHLRVIIHRFLVDLKLRKEINIKISDNRFLCDVFRLCEIFLRQTFTEDHAAEILGYILRLLSLKYSSDYNMKK